MLKILVKTAVLVFIILSIYFIVNPSACSNFLTGRVPNNSESQIARPVDAQDHGEMFTPSGDKPLRTEPQPSADSNSTQEMIPPTDTLQDNTSDQKVVGITDTNTLTEEQLGQEPFAYSQDDIDYAIASRYVELENEYAKLGKAGKDIAKELSYTVMDDFELTQQDWEAFLARATASNLFERVRADMEKNK